MMANRLATESSPYLRQHADNPVDWYPWGPEAFAAAVAQNKPILLSVGYAACHWCHVMAHESFEDAETAALMNLLFINVKVDREERPDVDAIYMQAVQAMTGHGGWPMTVALTPAGAPYWGGTYFPRDERPGMPSFQRVLHTIAAAWHERRDAVTRTTTAMLDLLQQQATPAPIGAPLDRTVPERAMGTLARRFDPIHGGFDGAPKFPQAMSLDFCLRWHRQTGEPNALVLAHQSFLAMVRGGIHDQVGGGFHRYTVDAAWLVPHFEKMLYDNALLTRLGVHLWQVTRDPEVRQATEAALVWVEREMTAPTGGFYASYDADSEGEEGRFYLWDPTTLREVLGDDADLAMTYWGVTPGGNFEGRSILHVPVDPATVARRVGMTPDALQRRMTELAARLYAQRSARIWPGLDDKILAAWNGLMCRALAEAAMAFDAPRWGALAIRNGEFLRDHLVHDGRVTRVFAGGTAKGPGFLEDHAAVALAFQALHRLTGDAAWQAQADRIGAVMGERFRDPASGAWYDTAQDAEPLIIRPRDVYDNATPAGGSLALEVELAMARRTGDAARAGAVATQLAGLGEAMTRWPNGFGHALGVALEALTPAAPVETASTDRAAVASPAPMALQADPALQLMTGPGLACGPEGCDPLPPSATETPAV